MARSSYFRLLILALANIALLAALSAFPRKPWGIALAPIISGIVLGQLALLAVVAAFVPRRIIAGLLSTVACVIANDFAMTAFGRSGAIRGIVMLEHGFVALSALAAFQGVRLIAGWRLLALESTGEGPGRQFRVMDMLEWTTAIALCLGSVVWLNLLVRESGRNNALWFLDWVKPLVQLTMLGAPVVLLLLSARLPGFWKTAALAIWSVFVIAILFSFDLRFVPLSHLLAMSLRTGASHLVAYMVAIVGDALVLRRIGFRWRGGGKPA